MTIATWYNRCALALALLAIVAYSTASSSPEFAVLAVPTVFALWRFSSRKPGARGGRFLLPRFVVNILLFAVLAYAALRAQGRLQVETIAQVIVLIQIIKIGDRRAPRDDAQVLCLTVFLAIAAMLDSNDVWTGALLIAFLPLLVTTVMLYQLYKGAVDAAAGGGEGPGLLGVGRSEAVDEVAGWRRGLRRTSAFATMGTLGLALVVFVLMPRGIGENVLGNFGTVQDRKRTGFTSNVTLGSRGIISSSPTVVMDLVVRDSSGANVGSAEIVQYLRGAVLTEYESRRWSTDGSRYEEMSVEREPVRIGIPRGQIIEQSISMRASPSSTEWMHLFAMWRPVEVAFGRRGTLGHSRSTIVLRRKADAGPFEYTVWSVPFEQKPQVDDTRTEVKYTNPRLEALATSILTQAMIDPDRVTRPMEDEGRAARAIQDHLRTNYGYTLEQEAPPKDVDPVEHFLFDRKAGHCEYFASAMVLLCRSVGINARMVTGYIATEFASSTGAYTVRESNAHAWVETEEDQHRWKRYDPTPPEDLSRIHRPDVGLFGRLRQAIEAVEYAWNSSIVAFNEKTRQSIFGPTVGREEQVGWLGRVERFSQRVRGGGARLMFTAMLTGAVVFLFVAVCGILIAAIIRRVFGLRDVVGRRWSLAAGLGRDRPGFYRAMLRLLARRGLTKPAWMPPLAHADSLVAVDGELADDVRHVVELYYKQRFAVAGQTRARKLDRSQSLTVAKALDRIKRFRSGGVGGA